MGIWKQHCTAFNVSFFQIINPVYSERTRLTLCPDGAVIWFFWGDRLCDLCLQLCMKKVNGLQSWLNLEHFGLLLPLLCNMKIRGCFWHSNPCSHWSNFNTAMWCFYTLCDFHTWLTIPLSPSVSLSVSVYIFSVSAPSIQPCSRCWIMWASCPPPGVPKTSTCSSCAESWKVPLYAPWLR